MAALGCARAMPVRATARLSFTRPVAIRAVPLVQKRALVPQPLVRTLPPGALRPPSPPNMHAVPITLELGAPGLPATAILQVLCEC